MTGTPAGLAPSSISSTQDVIATLEAAYGPPSAAAFGSAVFHTPLDPATDLEQAALAHYRAFVGPLWDRFGAEAWSSAWREVYRRPKGQTAGIVTELQEITDPQAASAIDLLLNGREDADTAQRALKAAYDDPALVDMRIFTIGDGAALSDVLVAGCRQDATETSLVFLMD